jgi:hypothetical protein
MWVSDGALRIRPGVLGLVLSKGDVEMRLLVVALSTLALSAPVALADPLDEVLSIARRIGFESGVITPDRPRYVVRDETYGPSNGAYSYSGWPDGVPRNVRSASRLPVGEELMQMDFPLLHDVAREAAVDFDQWLRAIPAGEVWRKHFETPALLELLAGNQSVPPSAADRQKMMRILGIFDRAVATSDMNDLTSQPSARTLQAALRELATPAEQRLVRQLSLNARMLNRTLGAFSTGVTWQRYLALPDEVVAAADRPPGEDEPRTDFDSQELDQIVVRYDLVSRNPEYAAIAALPEFQATHQRLTELVIPPLQEPPPLPSAAVAEELPPPELQIQ